MARTRQIKPRFLYSASMRKVSVGCISRYRVSNQPYLRVVNWRKHQRIAHPTPSKRPGESAGTREAFESASGTAHQPITKKEAEGASGMERTAVFANSGTAVESHGRFPRTASESADDGASRRFHERVERKLAFLHNRG